MEYVRASARGTSHYWPDRRGTVSRRAVLRNAVCIGLRPAWRRASRAANPLPVPHCRTGRAPPRFARSSTVRTAPTGARRCLRAKNWATACARTTRGERWVARACHPQRKAKVCSAAGGGGRGALAVACARALAFITLSSRINVKSNWPRASIFFFFFLPSVSRSLAPPVPSGGDAEYRYRPKTRQAKLGCPPARQWNRRIRYANNTLSRDRPPTVRTTK